MIYLASPYSHPSVTTMLARYYAAKKFTTKQLQSGVAIFSPIVYGRQMEGEMGTAAADWASFNDNMLPLCEEVWVLCLQGWMDSIGVAAEIKLAELHDIPVRYFEPDGEEIHVDN